MWQSIKKYFLILKTLKTLADRPYLAEIEENPDGTIIFSFVQKGKVFRFMAEQADVEYFDERVLN